MSYQVIWEKSAGTLQGSLPVVVQGSTLETITILSLYRDGTAVNLTGKTITATATDSDDNTTSLTGTFTGAATYFTWELSAGDVGTADSYTVIVSYTDGVDTWASDPVRFIVRPNPAADTVQNPSLVGIPASDAGWVAAGSAGGALGSAAYEDTDAFEPALGNPDVNGYVLSSTTLGVRSWVEQSGGSGGGDFFADGSVPMTDTLELEGIGDGGNATVLQIPVSSADGADFNFNINSVLFSSTYDTTFNCGFNNGGAGPANGAKHAWYLQLEYDYASAGTNFVEYHLNLYPVGGGDFRPFQYQYKKDGTDGAIIFKTANFYISSIGGTQVLQFTTLGTATAKFRTDAILQFNTPARADAFSMVSATNNIAIMALDGTTNDLSFRGRLIYFKNITSGNTFLTINPSADVVYLGGSPIARFSVTMPNDSYKGIVVKGVAGQTKTSLEIQNESSTVLFALAPNGNIRTNQTTVNTATPSGATAHQLPIYNEAGTLLGYIPVYAAAWT